MDIEKLPKLKDSSKIDRLTIPVDKKLKQQLSDLKIQHRINVTEWIRQIILKELSQLKKS